ncbi:hypothetical protein J3458_004283 [Metarhizium acridum]|uniref:uncharacterized protein n=1 Tax=Metarhizium acridum TaxID=92637 RepID=UPI001C6CF6A3|nr:hypothetical protein J3458_004283 [Metarhizium acridum]
MGRRRRHQRLRRTWPTTRASRQTLSSRMPPRGSSERLQARRSDTTPPPTTTTTTAAISSRPARAAISSAGWPSAICPCSASRVPLERACFLDLAAPSSAEVLSVPCWAMPPSASSSAPSSLPWERSRRCSPSRAPLCGTAEFLVDPAWGFAIGWNLVYGNILSIPSEITAICVLFEFWTDVNPSVWIVTFIVLTLVVGISFVRIFGEVEFFFAVLKILLVVFLIVLGLVIDLGGVRGTPPVYFKYWDDPGPFVEYIAAGSWGKFLGYWSVMTGAVFSFAGVESIAMAGAETKNPRKAIPAACKNVFVRIVLFYMLAILIVGMLVSSRDSRLDNESGDAAQSPFVIAASAAGIPAIPSVVNAVVITSAWSASNQSLLAGTRVLYGLAVKKQAPKVFLRTTSWGVPYVCVFLFITFSLLSFMSLSNDAITVFWWLVNLTAAGVLVSWISILINHIRLRLAMKEQAIPITRLPWWNSWTLYSSYFALFMCIVILLTGGFAVFTEGNWNASNFVSAYLDIPLVLAAYFIWKFVKKTKIVALADIPLQRALERADQKYESLAS